MRWCAVLILLVATRALALPAEQFSQDSQDDATVRLVVLDRFIVDDARSHCSMRIEVTGDAVDLSEGDPVYLWLYEDDLLGDDVLWRTQFAVTADEAAAGLVDRTFDCSAEFEQNDLGDVIEVYAKARVEKDDCGFTCRYDRPSTSVVEVERIEDDDNEPDNGPVAGRDKPLGLTADRVARNQDWFRFELVDQSSLVFTVTHLLSAGRLELRIFDVDNAELGAGVPLGDRVAADIGPLAPGFYFARIQPVDGDDFNFYDAHLQVTTGGCQAGGIEEQPCGNCGSQRRTCDDSLRWGAWSECLAEGACSPGSSRDRPCGNCGSFLQRCDDSCMWEPGACENEGPCLPGREDLVECDGEAGLRARLCTEACEWTEFGPCEPNTCVPGEERLCYDGEPGTADVGLCERGSQRCINGVWAPCDGQVLPAQELCDDGVDNNCDGLIDGDDLGCEIQPGVGDPCGADGDCGPALRCLDAPSSPQFVDGYCGLSGCDRECVEGICGRAFGQSYCLKECERQSDCRVGYVCADVDSDRLGCVPRCTADADCEDRELSACDRSSGVCVFGQQPDMQFVEAPPADAGGTAPPVDVGLPRIDAGEGLVGEPACACESVGRRSSRSGGGALLGVLFGAAFASRRRRRR